ncbi:MAG: 2-oxoglutarate dehydrogenase E1 component [bacterium]
MNSLLERFQADTELFGANAPYVEALYESYIIDSHSVPEQWRTYFKSIAPEQGIEAIHSQSLKRIEQAGKQRHLIAGSDSVQSAQIAEKQAAALRLINAYRVRGHLRADLDPLKQTDRPDAEDLNPGFHGLTAADLNHEFNTGSLFTDEVMRLDDIIKMLERIYCQNIGYEYMHLTSLAEKRWLQSRIESNKGHITYDANTKKHLLEKLTAADGIERYLHTRYVGQKRFSLEGSDVFIPLMHDLIQRSSQHGVEELVIGMAHRGRLNMLVNVLGKSPSDLFAEFEGKGGQDDPGKSGDVKYHLGFSSNVTTEKGEVHLALSFNPSHLEIIAPVVAGSVRARQIRREDAAEQVMPIIVHGDSAFPGQGVNMELFNMSQARGFRVGGTFHIIINNQIGFTTSNPLDTRSTMYATEVAKMVQAPIFHVNGDNPEAVRFAMEIAADFRSEFKKDVLIDLVTYRRHGHNEADEPAATQPIMYSIIRQHPRPREIYQNRLIEEGIMSMKEAQQMVQDYRQSLERGEQVAEVIPGAASSKFGVDWTPFVHDRWDEDADTSVSIKQLSTLYKKIDDLPKDLELHSRVKRVMDDRRRMARGELPCDWGFAETVAYASLLEQGFGVRLVGQDSGRGTFFHRHAVLHNQKKKECYTPLEQFGKAPFRFKVIDSVLSEEAVLGFEYGYATAEPNTLVIWEAQFGDFANGAQVVIDQFISSGEAKWNRRCGLVMFLPHGYEGQGPEHSSARLERYMQLCAQYNMQVCMPTTPAQMFHMLRRQMVRNIRKPLIVLTPKSLLRHKASVSSLDVLAEGQFQKFIKDPIVSNKKQIKRVVCCSGKVYYDLDDARRLEKIKDVAIVRVEQLYPFPRQEIAELVKEYPNCDEVVWCQEEPRNQGAWYQVKHHMQFIKPDNAQLIYAGRRRSPSPAVGNYGIHVKQQQRLVHDAIVVGQGTMFEVE